MIQIWKKDIDPTTFFVYRQVYDPNGDPIEGAYVDVNGDNTITEIDRQPYKKGSPDFYMGLSSNFNYKDFDFSFTWRGSFGGYMYNNMQSATGFRGAGTVTPQPYYSNFNANVLETDFDESQFFSDYYVQSSDFVKLDNVSIGYLIAGEKVDFRASLTASNVLTITSFSHSGRCTCTILSHVMRVHNMLIGLHGLHKTIDILLANLPFHKGVLSQTNGKTNKRNFFVINGVCGVAGVHNQQSHGVRANIDGCVFSHCQHMVDSCLCSIRIKQIVP